MQILIVPIAYILVVVVVFVHCQTEQYNGFSSKRKKEITDFSKCRSAWPLPLVFTLQLGGKAGAFAMQCVEQCADYCVGLTHDTIRPILRRNPLALRNS